MARLLKLLLALGIPVVAVWILMRRGMPFPPQVSALQLVAWFAAYVLAVAAPQLIVCFVGAVRSLRTSAVFGGLLALDTCLLGIESSIFHSNDTAGLGWLLYLAASPFIAAFGMGVGHALQGLTRRCS